MVDWAAAIQSLLNGLAWGIGFIIPFAIGLTYAAWAILNHKTAVRIARAADKLSGAGDDIWGLLIKELFGWLKSGKEPQKSE